MTTCMPVWCVAPRKRGSRCRSCCAGRRFGWRHGHRSRSGSRGPVGGPPRCPPPRCWRHWTSGAASGQMLVVDASCLFEVVADTPRSGEIAARLAAEVEQAAPHVIDVEVMGLIRAQHLRGQLDGTAAAQAVADLRDWPGERVGHRWLLERAWQLRDSIRGWDAFYVALAEALRCDATDAGRAACPCARTYLPDRGSRCAGLNVTRTRSQPAGGRSAQAP